MPTIRDFHLEARRTTIVHPKSLASQWFPRSRCIVCLSDQSSPSAWRMPVPGGCDSCGVLPSETDPRLASARIGSFELAWFRTCNSCYAGDSARVAAGWIDASTSGRLSQRLVGARYDASLGPAVLRNCRHEWATARRRSPKIHSHRVETRRAHSARCGALFCDLPALLTSERQRNSDWLYSR